MCIRDRLKEWKERHLNPVGEIVENLGITHTPSAEFKAILHKYELRPEFPEEVLREVAGIPSAVSYTHLDVYKRQQHGQSAVAVGQNIRRAGHKGSSALLPGTGIPQLIF